jgi:hypothetical protein
LAKRYKVVASVYLPITTVSLPKIGGSGRMVAGHATIILKAYFFKTHANIICLPALYIPKGLIVSA